MTANGRDGPPKSLSAERAAIRDARSTLGQTAARADSDLAKVRSLTLGEELERFDSGAPLAVVRLGRLRSAVPLVRVRVAAVAIPRRVARWGRDAYRRFLRRRR